MEITHDRIAPANGTRHALADARDAADASGQTLDALLAAFVRSVAPRDGCRSFVVQLSAVDADRLDADLALLETDAETFVRAAVRHLLDADLEQIETLIAACPQTCPQE